MHKKTRNITHAALIGAMYFALTHLQNLLLPGSTTWVIQCRAAEALEIGLTPDAVLTDAEEAMNALGELSGRTLREDLVDAIFSRFCVGK